VAVGSHCRRPRHPDQTPCNLAVSGSACCGACFDGEVTCFHRKLWLQCARPQRNRGGLSDLPGIFAQVFWFNTGTEKEQTFACFRPRSRNPWSGALVRVRAPARLGVAEHPLFHSVRYGVGAVLVALAKRRAIAEALLALADGQRAGDVDLLSRYSIITTTTAAAARGRHPGSWRRPSACRARAGRRARGNPLLAGAGSCGRRCSLRTPVTNSRFGCPRSLRDQPQPVAVGAQCPLTRRDDSVLVVIQSPVEGPE